ncbi:MAG TPA: FtsX-like permease family protein [Burkholderiales bacterium]|nr:FtsX-like permease family protein [Burkholderiales bacterium]
MDSFLPFEWIAASRFLREGRMQTIAIILGIGIGVGVIIFMSAALAGQMTNITRRVLSAQAHIVLIPPQEIARPLRGGDVAEAAHIQKPFQRVRSIDQWQTIAKDVGAIPAVTAVSPMAAGAVLAVRGEASRSVTIQGVEPAQYFAIVPLPDKIVAGSARLGAEDIVVGVDLASDLGARVGDKLRIAAASGQGPTLTISGIIDLGNKGANQRTAYCALHTAQALLGLIGGVSSIDITVRDFYTAEDIAQQIEARTGGVEADSWIKTNNQLYLAINAQRVANTTIRFFVGLAIAFGIAAVLIVSVVQKSKEIGILRAMGASRGQILRVFLLEGAVLGLVGSFIGSVLAALAIILWGKLVKNPDGTPLFPLDLDPKLFLAAAVLATLSGLIAAYLPALRGARVDPVVAIRG